MNEAINGSGGVSNGLCLVYNSLALVGVATRRHDIGLLAARQCPEWTALDGPRAHHRGCRNGGSNGQKRR